jgi:Na+(H+)/acetate symporter ActP
MIPTIAVLSVVTMTLILGTTGLRYARTTSNFFVASRSVHPAWNAFAVCGEAMSAASYLGAPALIMVFGPDMLWPIAGWTVGFLLLSLFLAAPMRRFGSYTIPEFVEGRLDSPALRTVVAIMVVVASWFFFLAQLKGAGVVTRALIGTPYWVGVVAVGVLVAANLSAGGMRGITFVQGFQFFFIFLGILIPFVVITTVWARGDVGPIITDGPPVFIENTVVEYPNEITVIVDERVLVGGQGSIDGSVLADFGRTLEPGPHVVAATSELEWPAGTLVPHAEGIDPLTGEAWGQPLGEKDLSGGHPLYFSLASFVANMFGLTALPHVVVRFYTNPTGRAARRTNLYVLALITPYYAMLPMFSAVGRVVGPEVLSNGTTDAITVLVGERLIDGLGGELVTAIVAAGAVAAFLSTSSGLLIAIAGAVSHDMMSAGVPQFRRAVWVGAAVSVGAGLAVEQIDINVLIGWSTAIAASSICPLLLLGIWWTGLTSRGAMAAAVTGGALSTGAVLVSWIGVFESGWPVAIFTTPAAWTVPIAFAVAVIVSKRDRNKVADIGYKFALMHVPEIDDQVDQAGVLV